MNDSFAISARWAAVVGVLLLLTACGPAYTTRVVETPQTQGLKGWQKSYTVNGQRYDPLMSHVGFEQEGRASWYGKDFHGKKTSNGEIYDMHAMTAAHKTLPLGVFVRVRNLDNGREEVVRINDRGPFVQGRIIDLSFAAAEKLGVVAPGTAPVHIEALGYRSSGPEGEFTYTAPVSYDVGNYAVQIGAFTVAENARRLASEQQQAQGAAGVSEGWVNGQRFYRVRVGDYQSLTAAETAKEHFADQGFHSSFVVAVE